MSSDDDTVPYLKKPETKKNADADKGASEGFGFHSSKDGDSSKLDQIDADQLSLADSARVFVGGKFQAKPQPATGGFNPYNNDQLQQKKEPQMSIQSKNAKLKAEKQEKEMRYLDQVWGAGKKS